MNRVSVRSPVIYGMGVYDADVCVEDFFVSRQSDDSNLRRWHLPMLGPKYRDVASVAGIRAQSIYEQLSTLSLLFFNLRGEYPNLPKSFWGDDKHSLPLAVAGLVHCLGDLDKEAAESTLFLGSLSSSGAHFLPVKGVSAYVQWACRLATSGIKRVVVPEESLREALEAARGRLDVHGADTLAAIHHYLKNGFPPGRDFTNVRGRRRMHDPDISEIVGQRLAKEALAVCAMTRMSLLLIGPAGAGKTMITRRLPTILPPMTVTEQMHHAWVSSVSGLGGEVKDTPPFRAPHYTVSLQGLVGKRALQLGELHLAHPGVLFLDEVDQTSPLTLKEMRHAMSKNEFARPILVGSASDYIEAKQLATKEGRFRHNSRLTSRMEGMFDMSIRMDRLTAENYALFSRETLADNITSEQLRERIIQARPVYERLLVERHSSTPPGTSTVPWRQYKAAAAWAAICGHQDVSSTDVEEAERFFYKPEEKQ